MADRELKLLAVISDLVVRDLTAWSKTKPRYERHEFFNTRMCAVAQYITARTDDHVLSGYINVDGILVHHGDVWNITHVYGTPVFTALFNSVNFGQVADGLAAIYDDADNSVHVLEGR